MTLARIILVAGLDIQLTQIAHWAARQNFCCLLFKTAYIPSPSHRALNFSLKSLEALCIGEGINSIIFMCTLLKGRQQKFEWERYRYLFSEVTDDICFKLI